MTHDASNLLSSLPVLPASGPTSCAICWEDIESLSYSNSCLHAFCFGCVREWIQRGHSQCPFCRQVVDFICYNVRSVTDYDIFEAVPMVNTRSYGHRINGQYWSIRAPREGLYMVSPHRASSRLYYVLQYLPREAHYVMRTDNAGGRTQTEQHQSSTLFVAPAELPQIVRRLENAGIKQYFPHLARHAPFLGVHHKH